MFQIEVAGLVIGIRNRYDPVRDFCREYITEKGGQADLEVEATDEEIRKEWEKEPGTIGEEYLESVVLYKKISCALPDFDAFVMHSSVVEVNGQAYAFAAASGTGKSTHTRYWKEVLGDRMTIINGDKPIYRFKAREDRLNPEKPLHSDPDSDKKEELFAFGTPWCGKEGWQKNTGAPLKALCLLERGENNEIFPVDPSRHLAELFKHFHLPGDGLMNMPRLIGLIDRMIAAVPVYRLRCRNDRSAAETAISYFKI